MDSSSGQTSARRIVVLVALLVLVVSASTATPAAAHANPAHFATKITSIDPAVPGLHVSTSSDGAYLTITNPTHRIVIVLGYDHEPYLKVTKHAVWHNTHSPATYLNEDLAADAMPPGVNAAAAPAWERISDSNSRLFDDRRIHWIGNSLPAAVEQKPNKPHLIRNWTVDLRVDDTPVTVRGTLEWYPGDSPTAWLVFGIVCTILLIGFLIALVRNERRAHRHIRAPR